MFQKGKQAKVRYRDYLLPVSVLTAVLQIEVCL